ncbi:hypothetical protein [Rosenbergiella collisarenosi]|uniref:hypothetical protein n=1 Tax=Rosenbergiella collisarenosi TaxID=1544695 RepID=UPI001F4D8F2D|nr:hypothetical protein [Rosenbergiella collisarenosi]
MRQPFKATSTKMTEEEFLTAGTADNTLPRSKEKKESYKAYTVTLPTTSTDAIKRAQLRLLELGNDKANRSDIVRAALALIDKASDDVLIELINNAKA